MKGVQSVKRNKGPSSTSHSKKKRKKKEKGGRSKLWGKGQCEKLNITTIGPKET